MNISTLICIVALTLFSFNVKGQDTQLEKFNGEKNFKECLVDLPLTYMPKEKEQYIASAKSLKDKELIFLTFDKKKKTAVYQRLFVIVINGKNGESVYLETKEDHQKASGNKQALFTRYYPKKNNYYLAQCFDEVLEKKIELRTYIKEE